MVSAIKNWDKAKKKELSLRILKLANKITFITNDIVKFGKRRISLRNSSMFASRNGMIRHWHKMSKFSLMATRKKLYRLQEELKRL